MAIDRVADAGAGRRRRAHNFGEVNLGLTEQLAMLEAERCLECKNHVHRRLPGRGSTSRGFIARSREGDLPPRPSSLLGDNALPGVSGRVCPQENQCEGDCIRGKKGDPVAIGYLERFVADWAQRDRDGADPRTPRRRAARRWPSSAPVRPV